MNYITRHMEKKILELSHSYSAILLTGPRQSGKTTMLRLLAEKENKGREYVSLDDLSTKCSMPPSFSLISKFTLMSTTIPEISG